MYLFDLAVKLQKLIPVEKAVLKDYIYECAESELLIIPRLFRDLANEFYRAKEDYKLVGKNWHLSFYNRYISVESKYATFMKKARLINENADIYIA
jgi:hypothetical protein